MRRAATALLLLVGACTKSQAELERADRERLEAVLAADGQTSIAMSDADHAAHGGDLARAREILVARVGPALDAEARVLERAAPTTAWGRARRDDLGALLAERRAAVDPYRDALGSDEPERVLSVVETQAKIERHALAAVAAMGEGR